MKFVLVAALSATFAAMLPAQAGEFIRHAEQIARNDKNDQPAAADATPGKGHGKGNGNSSGHGGNQTGGADTAGASAVGGASVVGSGHGRNHGSNQMGGSNTAGASTAVGGAAMSGGASTVGSGRSHNRGTGGTGGSNTAGVSTVGGGAAMSGAATVGSGRSHNRGTGQMGGSTAIGGAAARSPSTGGTGASGQVGITVFGTRPSNWNRYPRQFDSNVYQRNITAPRQYHWQSYNRPSGWYYQRWVFGQIFPRMFWSRDYWIRDYWMFDLPIPPYGYEWVRYGDDAVLVNVRTGRVLQVVYGLFD